MPGHFPAVEVDSTFHAAPTEDNGSSLGRNDSSQLSVYLQASPPDHPRLPSPRLRGRAKFVSPCNRTTRAKTPRHPHSATAFADARRTASRRCASFSCNCRGISGLPIEFRHAGWHRPQFIRLVEKYRICWVWADTTPLNERNLAPFEFLPCTTDFLYLRLLGDYATKYDVDGGHIHRYEKLLWKREAALESWSLKIQRHLADVRSVWAFAGNHFEGFAPETCQRLAERLGFDLPLPPETEQAFSAERQSQLDLQL